ncbi:MAG: hypothetical protein IJR66_04780 [Clostridia bacterium]|nr:hypothetical protein [Clostridia bacterium]
MIIIKKRISSLFNYLIFFFFIALAVIFATGKLTTAFKSGLTLWFLCVLPALFPYFFITAILSSLSVTHKLANKCDKISKPLFNVGGQVFYAYLMSIISGYPVGAKLVSSLKENGIIENAESERGIALCSTSSPVFIIGSVGGIMLKDAQKGLYIFLAHILSSIICGIIFSFYKRGEKPKRNNFVSDYKTDNLLYESVYSAVITVLIVGGIISVFFCITEIMNSLKILSIPVIIMQKIVKDGDIANGFIFGLFETTKGLNIIARSKSSLAIPFCAFLCSFGGLSVIIQSLAFFKKAKIKTAPFLLSKITQAVLSFIIAFILCRL